LLRLPEDRASRTLVLAIITSVVFHLLLLGPFFVYGKWLLPDMYQKRGEPLLVDIAPEKPEEKAPLGNPSRPVGPPESQSRPAPPPSPPSPRIPPAPRVAAVRPAPPAPAAPKTPPAPPAAKAEPPAPDAMVKSPEPKPPAPETPAPETPSAAEQAQAAAPASPPQVASRIPPGMRRQPGGGGGLLGGRGGVEGEPIPLDSPDPKFQDYLRKVREKIRANWSYPREAGDRGIEGELLIEFHIAKDGHLEYIELRQTSGTEILDFYAMNAIKFASPFPPVPDTLAKQSLAIHGQFRYQIVSGLVNQFLR